jgi:hypothetical protein
MHHIRKGFKCQRLTIINPKILLNSQNILLTKSLYPFPDLSNTA